MLSSVAVFAGQVLLGAQHRPTRSTRRGRQGGTNGCSPGTEVATSVPSLRCAASGRSMGDRPSGNQSFL